MGAELTTVELDEARPQAMGTSLIVLFASN